MIHAQNIHAYKSNPASAACGAPPGPGQTWVSAYTEDKHRTNCGECRRLLGLPLRPEDPRPEPAPEISDR